MRRRDSARGHPGLIALAVVLLTALPALAAPGDLDPGFGEDGVATPGLHGGARDVAIQPDGKIVAGGGDRRRLVRLTPTGKLDPSFGTGGIVEARFHPKALALQQDSKIVIASWVATDEGTDVAVARYLADGLLDPSFSDNGALITRLRGPEYAYDVAVQPNGRIVVAGQTRRRFLLLRYLEDGSLDPSFGGDGIVKTPIGSTAWANTLALQDDGKIVAAGGALHAGGCRFNFAVARYRRHGALNESFGRGGTATVCFGDEAEDVAVQANGKIVVVGGLGDFGVVRLRPSGRLDPGFGRGGKRKIDLGGLDGALGVGIQPDRRILAVGYALWDTDDPDIALVRLKPDGRLDRAFGEGGKTLTDLGGSIGQAVAIQPDEKAVVAASSFHGFTLVRYLLS